MSSQPFAPGKDLTLENDPFASSNADFVYVPASAIPASASLAFGAPEFFAVSTAAPFGAAGSPASSGVSSQTTKTAPGGSNLSNLSNGGIEADVARLIVNNSLSYGAMLTILQDAAAGGMTASKFATLQALAGELNTSGGIAVSAYVQQIADDVILGNPANAAWTGGAATTVALGNLSAASSQTQANELIGKWFLGTDLPSMSVSSIGEANYHPTYQNSSSPLYASSGAPSYLDVNQGYLGDCYFLSSIAEVALKDPTGIESMIASNGNGTYGVRFIVNGQPEYVTVNAELPTLPAGYGWANGSDLEFANGSVLWPELLEKAYAELNAEPNAPHGAVLDSAVNSYAGIDAGYATALTEITGQSVTGFSLSPHISSASLAADASQLSGAWNANEEVLVETSNISSGNIVSDHMYEVVGFNAATDALTLHNPWGSAYSGPMAMTFSETLSQLCAVDASVYMTTGKPMA